MKAEGLWRIEDYGGKVVWFVAGIAIGATIALLYAPASGEATRRQSPSKTQRSREALADSGKDMLDRGKEMYDRGRKLADDAADMFERGRKIVESTAVQFEGITISSMSSYDCSSRCRSLPAFSNEPVADFSKPANREAMEKALGEVRAQFGREYDLLIAGPAREDAGQTASLNPSRPSRSSGIHSKATAAHGARGGGSRRYAYFPGVERRRRAETRAECCCARPR